MVLSEVNTYKQVLGCLMKNPLLLTEYQDIQIRDFDTKITKLVFVTINNMFQNGAVKLEPMEIDINIESHESASVFYVKEKGLDFVKDCYEVSKIENFDYYYNIYLFL